MEQQDSRLRNKVKPHRHTIQHNLTCRQTFSLQRTSSTTSAMISTTKFYSGKLRLMTLENRQMLNLKKENEVDQEKLNKKSKRLFFMDLFRLSQ